MKFSLSLLTLVCGALAVPAHHVHKRDAYTVLTTQTTVVYVTDGAATTSVASVEAEASSSSSAVTTSLATSVTSAAPSSSSEEVVSSSSSSSSEAAASSDSSDSSDSSSSSSSSSGSSSVDGDLEDFADPSGEFKDGVHSCDSLPTGNGVVAITWLDYDGWASITNSNGDTTSKCKDGYYCSYACQAGMSKTQWPSNQPSSGESRGGLVCKNGKLYRTNTDTKYLCEWGEKSAYAVNKLDKVISLCRTDYPGSENMNIPTRLPAGSTKPMSVVNGDSYFKWKGGSTSAQYYVNNAGVDVEDGCVWGTSSGDYGNWAPVVLGAGKSGGITYLSIIPNPNNKTPPNYSVKIVGQSGSKTVGDCSYVDGKYNGAGSDGCTFSVTSGAANFVFF